MGLRFRLERVGLFYDRAHIYLLQVAIRDLVELFDNLSESSCQKVDSKGLVNQDHHRAFNAHERHTLTLIQGNVFF